MARLSQRPRRSSPHYLAGPFELFRKSSRLVRKHVWIFGPLYIIPFIFSFHAWVWTPAPDSHTNRSWWTDYSWFGSGFSASSIPTYMWYVIVGFSFLWLVIVVAAGTIIQIMAQQAQLEASAGKEALNFGQLWQKVKELGWRMLGLYLLIGVYIFAPVAIWLIIYWIVGKSAIIFSPLLIISLVMLRRYFLAPYLVLDKRLGITEAMDTSAEVTKAYSSSIWSIIAVMVFISFANVIPGVGWLVAFVLGSLYSVAPALRYQELKRSIT